MAPWPGDKKLEEVPDSKVRHGKAATSISGCPLHPCRTISAELPHTGQNISFGPRKSQVNESRLQQAVRFPTDITTTLRPYIILRSIAQKYVLLIVLTVEGKEGIQDGYETKKFWYDAKGKTVVQHFSQLKLWVCGASP